MGCSCRASASRHTASTWASTSRVSRGSRRNSVVPSVDAATNTYVALVTDTGDFRYSNARPRAFRAAAEMVERGAEPPMIGKNFFALAGPITSLAMS